MSLNSTFSDRVVSIIVPCRNERMYIENFLTSIEEQQIEGYVIEVLIADGSSEDGTREYLQEYSSEKIQMMLIDNPDRFVSVGLNKAILMAKGNIIIRMDVHTEYDKHYIANCVKLLSEGIADNVGGPARTKARTYMQQANCLAYNSVFSVGGAKFHDVEYSGYVDTVPYGCWYKKTLIEIGMFDEEFIRNQDDELNLRLVRHGKRIWQSKDIKSWYYPRSSIKAIFAQYAQYGYWKVKVIQKHRIPASLRHLVPASFLGALVITSILSLVSKIGVVLFSILSGSYLFMVIVASVLVCCRARQFKYIPVLPFIFGSYHFGYGYGFMKGILDFIILKHESKIKFSKLTR